MFVFRQNRIIVPFFLSLQCPMMAKKSLLLLLVYCSTVLQTAEDWLSDNCYFGAIPERNKLIQ